MLLSSHRMIKEKSIDQRSPVLDDSSGRKVSVQARETAGSGRAMCKLVSRIKRGLGFIFRARQSPDREGLGDAYL